MAPPSNWKHVGGLCGLVSDQGLGLFLSISCSICLSRLTLRHELLQLLNLRHTHANVSFLPPVEGLLRYPHLSTDLHHRGAILRLPQGKGYLLRRVSGPLHGIIIPSSLVHHPTKNNIPVESVFGGRTNPIGYPKGPAGCDGVVHEIYCYCKLHIGPFSKLNTGRKASLEDEKIEQFLSTAGCHENCKSQHEILILLVVRSGCGKLWKDSEEAME